MPATMSRSAVDNILQPFWYSVAPGTSAISAGTEYKLFATPNDGSSVLMSDTNQSKQGVCPFNFMKILRISAYCHTRSVTVLPTHSDVHKILANCTLKITKKKKPMLELPIIRIPSGVGITGWATNTNNSTLGVPSNGECLISNAYDVGINPNTGEPGIDFVLNEELDIVLRAEKTFTLGAATYIAIILWCDVDNVIN